MTLRYSGKSYGMVTTSDFDMNIVILKVVMCERERETVMNFSCDFVEPGAGFLPRFTALRAQLAEVSGFPRIDRGVHRTFLAHRLA